MAFDNTQEHLAATYRDVLASAGQSHPGQSFLHLATDTARQPWVYQPFVSQTVVSPDGVHSPGYNVQGRDTHKIVTYQKPGDVAPTGVSLEVWASYSGQAGSYVKVATITTATPTETTVTGPYANLVFYLAAITAGALTVDVCSYRAG